MLNTHFCILNAVMYCFLQLVSPLAVILTFTSNLVSAGFVFISVIHINENINELIAD